MEAARPIGAAAPELDFAIEGGRALEPAAVPTLSFDLRVTSSGGTPVRSVALNVEIRIGATRRGYSAGEQARLTELFGLPEQWGRGLHGLHWTSLAVQVPPFTGGVTVELPVTCTYDLEVTAARYFSALEEGEIPLEFLFTGTVFYADGDRLQVGRIDWDREAGHRLPVAVWREMIDRHFPDSAWLRLRRESFDRLREYRARNSLLTWEDALERLLDDEERR